MSERANTTVNKLFEASLSGSVQALEALIEEDQLVLDRVSFTCLDDTPLHVAALRGHLDFARALLKRKPKLAAELNSLRCSPLHLASAEGHLEIVRELLKANPEVCKARDQEGRIPLHLAVIKGRVEVVQVLIRARPDSILDKVLERGDDSVLHLCVKYNRLEVLKMLLGYLQSNTSRMGSPFINAVDMDGNTILHLAAAFKQLDTVQFLLGIKNVKEQLSSMKNQHGCTALDVLEQYPPTNTDLKRMEIRELLLEAGVPRARGRDNLQQQHPRPHKEEIIASSLSDQDRGPDVARPRSCSCRTIWKSVLRFTRKYFELDEDWFKEVRGHLITAATVTASMAYQAVISPPGGIWQDAPKVIHTTYIHKYVVGAQAPADSANLLGKSITGTRAHGDYERFMSANTISLIASLTTIFLAISGFPLRNKLFMWILILTMCTTITFMAFSYLLALEMVSPQQYTKVGNTLEFSILFWLGLCGIVVLLHLSRFLVWLGKKVYNFCLFIARLGNKCLKLFTARRPNDQNPTAIA